MKSFIIIISFFLVSLNAFSAPPSWTCNSSQYQYSMTFTGVIQINHVESLDTADIVGAFVGTECRGIAKPVYISALNRYLVFLVAYSNVASGENLTFKIYNADEDAIYTASQTKAFVSFGTEGMIENPYVWSYNTPSNKANILSYSFPQQISPAVIDTINHTIAVEVIYGTNVSSLTASFSLSTGATAKIGSTTQTSGVSVNDFTNPVIYTVTAENGINVTNWIVNVSVASIFSNEAKILSFSFPQQISPAVIDTTNRTVTITVNSTANLASLIAQFTLSAGATTQVNGVTQISGVSINDFSNPILYVVKAQNPAITKNWIVNVTKANGGTKFLSYSFVEQSGNASIDTVNHNINISVAYGTDPSLLVASFNLSAGAHAKLGSTVQQSGVSINNFTNPVVYKVIAEDTAVFQNWTVTVTVDPFVNNQADILSFAFAEQTGPAVINTLNHIVNIEVTTSTSLNNLIASFTLSGGAVAKVGAVTQISAVTSNNFTFPIIYTVTSEDASTTINWIVQVSNAPVLSTEANILSYSFPQQTDPAVINPIAKTVNIEVANGTVLTNLVATFNLSASAQAEVSNTIQQSGVTANDFTNPVIYKVIAEDTAITQDWTITVTEAVLLNDKAEITAFSFPEESDVATIDSANHLVNIQVVPGTSLTNLIASFTLSAGATAKIGAVNQVSGINVNNFTYPVIYTITSENGVVLKNWIVNVSIAPVISTKTDIISYLFSQQTVPATIDSVAHTVNIEVISGTNLTNLIASYVLSPGAISKVNGITQQSAVTANDFTNPVVYSVIAEDTLVTQNWTVSVTVSTVLNTKTDFISYSFTEQTGSATIDTTSHTISIEVVNGTNMSALVATYLLSGGAIAEVSSVLQQSGITANDFTNPVVYSVTAQNTSISQNWTVTVTEAPLLNHQAEILSYSFAEQTGSATINNSNHIINIEVNTGTSLNNLIATFTLSTGAVAKIGGLSQVSGVTGNDFNYPIIYSVFPEDGSAAVNWIVNVTVAPVLNTETDFTGFSFPQQTGQALINTTDHTINIEVNYGTDFANLVATFSLSNGAIAKISNSIQQSGVTSNDFTNPVIYKVMAEDTTYTQNWTVTVTEAPLVNNQADILTFAFAEQTSAAIINTVNHVVTIEVANGTSLSNLVATFNLSSGASAKIGPANQVSGTTSNDFTYPVIYTVTAENGTTVLNWIVNVSVAPVLNHEAKILSYSFIEQTSPALIDTVNSEITIEVEFGTDLTQLIANFTLSVGATAKINNAMQQSGITQNSFTDSVVYAVTAQDGTTNRPWTVFVSEAPYKSDSTKILTFTVPGQIGASIIDTINYIVDVTVPVLTDRTAMIANFTLSAGATAKISSTIQQSGVTVNNFSFPVIYTVTAEDSTISKNWIVIVHDNTDVEENQYKNSISVFPNPTNGMINITSNKNSELFIYDVAGREVLNNIIYSGISSFDLKNLDNGVYLLKLISGINVFNTKLLIRK